MIAAQPSITARVARLLRPMSIMPGWHALVDKFVPNSAERFLVRNHGILYVGDLASYIDRQNYLFGGYERSYLRCFLKFLAPCRLRTILDIGANVGTHTLAFAKYFQVVHAFEPNPALWAQFHTHVEINGVGNVQLHKVGLGEVDDELPFHVIDKPNFGLGTFSVVEQYDLPLRRIGNFPIRRGSSYLAAVDVESVDAVKIDVQGLEPEVLRGLSEVLGRERPLIWCEIGAGTRTKVSTCAELSKLIPFDFRCYQMVPPPRFSGGVARLRARNDVLPTGDYLVVPFDYTI